MNKLSIYKKKDLIKTEIKRPAAFFDRDGVLLEEKNYLSNPKFVSLEKGVLELLQKIKEMGYLIIIVTNQSGIGRGYFTWNEYDKVTNQMFNLIGDDTLIEGIYANSCQPGALFSNFRKPNPGMLIRAAEDFKIDLKNSFIVGDRLTDLQAGLRANLKFVIHVLTGHGRKERNLIKSKVVNFKDEKNSEYIQYLVESQKKSKIKFIDNLEEFPNDILIQI